MKKNEAQTLVDHIFTHPYNESEFRKFIHELFENYEPKNEKSYSGSYIREAFRQGVLSYKRLGKFIDPEGLELDILAVKVSKRNTLENARTMQRNFIAWYLNGSRGGEMKDAALVAFYADDSDDWRFSLVRMDYVLDEEKNKIRKELTPARRYSFLVGRGEKTHTVRKQLLPILTTGVETTISDLEKAFNIETVTKEFFEKYKALYIALKETLDQHLVRDHITKSEFDMKAIKTDDFAKRLLGQIVFLYFLQKKGWLGVQKGCDWGSGTKDFLQALYRMEYGDYQNFFNDVLEPLFYEALATERSEHYYNKLNCRIPFLNGGLFEPIKDYDWVNTDILLDNAIFKDVFETFDLYNFTVREDEPLDKEVAVDPEMLGKVFENLIPENERKGSGTFYTPREIVHYMCQESLINYLDGQLNIQKKPIQDKSEQSLFPELTPTDLLTKYEDIYTPIISREDLTDFIHNGDVATQHDMIATKKSEENENYAGDYQYKTPKSIRKYAQQIDNALANVKICDPAIGSGAFPVGMMNEIIRARGSLSPYLSGQKRTSYDFKRHAIQESIYGVDIEPSAVDIAKLRLWLSLVVDEDDFSLIKPLPNLDYKIVAGNSLIGFPFDVQSRSEKLRLLTPLKEQFVDAHSPSQKKALREKINEIIQSEYDRSSKASLGYEVNFDFKWSFFEVFDDKGGFDIVIGNPPYVTEGKNSFDAFKGTQNLKYYQGKMNLWQFFGCIGIDILSPNGIQSYIAPNNWITNSGASKLREKTIKEATLLEFIDFANYQVFDTASIQTMIYSASKNRSKTLHNVKYKRLNNADIKLSDLEKFLYFDSVHQLDFEAYFCEINRDDHKKIISFTASQIDKICTKIKQKSDYNLYSNQVAQGIVFPQDKLNKKNSLLLKNVYDVNSGVFLLSNDERKSLDLNNKENDILRPFYTTKELKKYYGLSQNLEWVIYTDSGFKNSNEIEKYPNVKKHLDHFKNIITSDNKPYGLHRAREEYFFKDEKIISLRKCSKSPTFTYTDFDCYVSATFFVIKPKDINLKYLTAILNSKLIAFWLWHKGKRQGNNYQIDKEPLLDLPLIRASSNAEEIIIKIIDDILNLKESLKETQYLEDQIDQLVYKLYDLTEDEIKIIESSV